ncbi:phosphonate ABC transporter, permease protein PhnE [Halomonas alkalisoli]|uniref:phosphonate ABC transporter, permease protein PhnE n=1 Tax=Halomonas alkalisoli TaxID=2907158 RepID=UPI001F3EFA90|nr:phosphonate ABC transporter, permease protein PhnE [Halomonas alkalisoli]MCE9682047.1 phosphonate ABC transporter, permease protein PhnE [Halomonas alkalisoli]
MTRSDVPGTTPGPRTWRKPSFIANPVLRYGLWLVVLVYLIWAFGSLPFNWERIAEGLPRAARIFGSGFPPSFERGGLLLTGFKESFQIAILATLLGVALSIPFAVMAARNIAPLPIYLFGRAVIIISRSFHPVIVAILFVAAVGFGPLAGVLTLTLYSIGFVGKLLAEEIEEIDWGQVEAMKATGAGYFSILVYAVFPQILPRQVGLSMYQLDSNLRASAVVGIVGAGGIGGTLMNAFGRYDYDFAFAILLIIIAVILVSEGISGWVRKKIW